MALEIHNRNSVEGEPPLQSRKGLSSDDVFQEPEQWLQRHPKAGLSWPSWLKVSHLTLCGSGGAGCWRASRASQGGRFLMSEVPL